jgi:UDP-3-O-[3-hydroxymyristoyl] glucosamine N-acyltransferase
MTLEPELPVNGIKIILLVGKVYIEVLAQDVGNSVELFQSAVIGNHGFGTAKVGS